ncbi:MAG TPA: cytochrome P450, partial [Streptomyces sp.]|uniref:cytochrome P450 n=1 Tax=Streptomyces sp. TaxID=1931 RepID=UPI002C282BD9
GFALPLPTLVICDLLGVPYEDHEFFQTRGAALFSANPPEMVGAAFGELAGYLDELVARKEREGADDLLGRVAARVDAGELTHEEAVAMARVLLLAGHETTANALALSVLTLLRHPDQLATLCERPELYPSAVEELLRLLTITQGPMPRLATEPIEVGGVRIEAGDGILMSLLAANRDERVHTGPDELDVHRDAGRHLAFGHGVHQCLGQSLARLELEVALPALFRSLPGLRLACAESDLRLRAESPVYGVDALPVTW